MSKRKSPIPHHLDSEVKKGLVIRTNRTHLLRLLDLIRVVLLDRVA
jgi:hypothetical protein